MEVKFATIDLYANEIEFLQSPPRLLYFPQNSDLNPIFFNDSLNDEEQILKFIKKSFTRCVEMEKRRTKKLTSNIDKDL